MLRRQRLVPALAGALCIVLVLGVNGALFSSAVAQTVTVNGVPLCDGLNGRPAHDPTQWHPLVARDSSGNVVCTYGHEHGMDPHLADSVFGALPLAQTISYPWATVSSTGVAENDDSAHPNKHRVYKWLETTSMPCLGGAPDGSNKAITAFREELHADGSVGATVRFHSFFGQYRLTDCGTGTQGSMTVGGHLDYAQLHLDSIVPLPGDPPANCIVNNDLRQHSQLGDPEGGNSVWYGSSNHAPPCDDAYGFAPHIAVQLNVGVNDFGPVDPANPSAVHVYAADFAKHTETTVGSDALDVWLSGFPTSSNGLINFTGHVDRHGNVVPEVAGQVVGQDYIPITIVNGKPGAYGAHTAPGAFSVAYNGDVPGPNGQSGYYVQPPADAVELQPTAAPATATPVPATATATATPVPPTATSTPVPPTATATATTVPVTGTVTVPAPPATGCFLLSSNNGVLQWRPC